MQFSKMSLRHRVYYFVEKNVVHGLIKKKIQQHAPSQNKAPFNCRLLKQIRLNIIQANKTNIEYSITDGRIRGNETLTSMTPVHHLDLV
jgi:hypothetical protein